MVNCLNQSLPQLAAAFGSDFLSLPPLLLKVDIVADKYSNFQLKLKRLTASFLVDGNKTQTQSSTIRWNLTRKSPNSQSLNSDISAFLCLILLQHPWFESFRNCLFWQYRKISKISPGAYIFQRPFLSCLILEGLIYGLRFVF